MAYLFDPAQATWSFKAQAADVLRTTQLRIPAGRFVPPVAATVGCGGRSAAWWAEAMRGQDFSVEDHLDTAAFNAALWRGLRTGPEPMVRSGADLRGSRDRLLANAVASAACGAVAGS